MQRLILGAECSAFGRARHVGRAGAEAPGRTTEPAGTGTTVKLGPGSRETCSLSGASRGEGGGVGGECRGHMMIHREFHPVWRKKDFGERIAGGPRRGSSVPRYNPTEDISDTPSCRPVDALFASDRLRSCKASPDARA